MAVGYDQVFEFAPQFGKYQLYVFIVAYLASCTIYGPMLTAGVYFQYEPDFRCISKFDSNNTLSDTDDKLINENLVFANLKNSSCTGKPEATTKYCHMYKHEIANEACTTEVSNGYSQAIPINDNSSCLLIESETEKCSSFVYSKEIMDVTITTENNLVCKDGWIDEMLTVATMVGMIIGPTVSGMISDRIGRIMSIVLFCFVSFGFCLINGCLGSYHWGIYGVFRLLSVLGSSGIGITYFVVVMESTGDRYRPRLGLLYITTTIGVGTVILSFVTMALRDWKYVQFVLAGFCCLMAFITRTIMETPRWLYAHDKYEHARSNVRKMASFSGMEIDDDTFDKFEFDMKALEEKSSISSGGIRDLFRAPRTRETTIIVMVNQFVRGIINYGFLFNIGQLGGNLYYNNIFNNLTGVFAFLLLVITIDNKYLGRKGNFISTLWLAGIASYCVMIGKFIGSDQLVNISSYVGMFASTAATSVGYVYTAEVYPTEIRNVGVGCCSSAAMAGALVSPLMKLLADAVCWLPPVINGTLALCAGLLSFWLPETNNEPMTTTIDEFEEKYGRTTNQVKPEEGVANPTLELEKF